MMSADGKIPKDFALLGRMVGLGLMKNRKAGGEDFERLLFDG